VAEALLAHAARHPVLLVLDNLESLPPQELEALRQTLARLPAPSAALLTLRTPLPSWPQAQPLPLSEGLAPADAQRLALALAQRYGVPLTAEAVHDLAEATAGHP